LREQETIMIDFIQIGLPIAAATLVVVRTARPAFREAKRALAAAKAWWRAKFG
jgi:hypothetical protein